MQKLIFFLLLSNVAFAQTVTISGFVRDSLTSEPLVGATVFETNFDIGTVTNYNGFYSLTIPSDSVQVCFSYIGYTTICESIKTNENKTVNISLSEGVSLTEVTVKASKHTKQPDLGKIELNPLAIKKMPTLMGEPDVLKAVQILPGISGGREGTSMVHIRGGSADQTLILLDDVPIYYPVHLGGFVSVFDANTINNITVYKGGISSKYGNRGAGVLDIRLKEGNTKEWKKEVGVGILASKIFVEGPIKKDTTTMMFAARRSLLDLFTRAAYRLQNNGEEIGYALSDGHFKIKHRLSQQHHLSASIYASGDNILLQFTGEDDKGRYLERSRIRWGNYLGSIQSQYFQPNYALTQALIFTQFNYGIKGYSEDENKIDNFTTVVNTNFATNIRDFGYKANLEYYWNNDLEFTVGTDIISHRFSPQIQSFESSDASDGLDTTINAPKVYAFETNVFAQADWSFAPNWQLNTGLRYTFFDVLDRNYNKNHFIQPRILLEYKPHENWSISAAYDKMNQFLHLLSNSGGGLPMDLWVPATENALPESVHQFSSGVHYTTENDNRQIKIAVEGYYKTLDNLIEFSEGVSFFRGNTEWENKIETGGKGISKGVEFLFQYDKQRFNTTIAYTLSKTTRQFETLNNGLEFPYRYDRRHDLAVSTSYKFKGNWRLNVLFIYNTGENLTLAQQQFSLYNLPVQQYLNYDFVVNNAHLYNGRNGYQAPHYHRLDISFQETKKVKRGERTLTFGVYNIYSRINPYYVYFKNEPDGSRQLYKFGLFPILPFASYVLSW
jgi:outer membrane receptor for ferrienterochelin and colicin